MIVGWRYKEKYRWLGVKHNMPEVRGLSASDAFSNFLPRYNDDGKVDCSTDFKKYVESKGLSQVELLPLIGVPGKDNEMVMLPKYDGLDEALQSGKSLKDKYPDWMANWITKGIIHDGWYD